MLVAFVSLVIVLELAFLYLFSPLSIQLSFTASFLALLLELFALDIVSLLSVVAVVFYPEFVHFIFFDFLYITDLSISFTTYPFLSFCLTLLYLIFTFLYTPSYIQLLISFCIYLFSLSPFSLLTHSLPC